jgi:hypothetical protein
VGKKKKKRKKSRADILYEKLASRNVKIGRATAGKGFGSNLKTVGKAAAAGAKAGAAAGKRRKKKK